MGVWFYLDRLLLVVVCFPWLWTRLMSMIYVLGMCFCRMRDVDLVIAGLVFMGCLSIENAICGYSIFPKIVL